MQRDGTEDTTYRPTRRRAKPLNSLKWAFKKVSSRAMMLSGPVPQCPSAHVLLGVFGPS